MRNLYEKRGQFGHADFGASRGELSAGKNTNDAVLDDNHY
jgi:hypothetical protein